LKTWRLTTFFVPEREAIESALLDKAAPDVELVYLMGRVAPNVGELRKTGWVTN